MKVKQLFKNLNIPTAKSKTRHKDIDAVKWVCYNDNNIWNYFWQPNLWIATTCLDCDFIYDAYNRNMKTPGEHPTHITNGLRDIKIIIESGDW